MRDISKAAAQGRLDTARIIRISATATQRCTESVTVLNNRLRVHKNEFSIAAVTYEYVESVPKLNDRLGVHIDPLVLLFPCIAALQVLLRYELTLRDGLS
jgi:hypothetical protein